MARARLPGLLEWLVPAIAYTVLALAFPSAADAQTPTAEQIEIFQNLPPEQQQAILESLGLDQASDILEGRGEQTSDSRRRDTRGRAAPRGARDRTTEVEGEPRLKPRDTLLISLELRQFRDQAQVQVPSVPTSPSQSRATAPSPQMTQPLPGAQIAPPRERIERAPEDEQRLEDFRRRIVRRNPFQLDKWGILLIPELGPIPLAGLTALEASQRLAAEPLLSEFIVKVTYLPLDPVGRQGLKPFGHSLFQGPSDTFAPATDIPVPSEYVVGPGDELMVQLVGSTRGRYSLVVRRDGRINFPEIGPIAVGGMRFDEVRALLEQRVAEQLIGTQASIQMGELRSIQVFVVGEVVQPGSYTVSGLSTISHVLFASGGPTEVGSLRKIELKRNGKTVTTFDFYDLLLNGDTSNDLRLVSGDVVLVPPVGPVVGVSGEVRRPALYELKGEKTIEDLVRLAGGLNTEADARLATVERISPERERRVIDVDLTSAAASLELRDGDVLHVPTIRPTLENSVSVEGHVHRPGTHQYREGLRVSDVIPSLEELKPMADQHYVLIRREVPPTRRIEYLSVDLAAALAQPGSEEDVLLAPRDRLFVFNLETGRDRILDPLLRELRLQSTRDQPTAQVGIGGRVNAPGQYPLERGMRVSDLIRAGGSLNEAAYGGTAELTRNATGDGEVRETELIEIDLARAMAGDPAHDIELQPFDYLIVKELPLWGAQEYVEIQGEVRFPGRYPIQRGETLRSVLERAGGVTELAFPEGAVFTRQSLKDRERSRLEDLTRRMQTDLAQVSLMAAQEARGDAAQALAVGQQLLENLRNAEPVGRLVINLERSLAAKPGSPDDIVLKDGDRLLVPRITQEVTVIGEVQSPTSHLYAQGLTSMDYIAMSGGLTQRADKNRIYVVRADGSVVSGGHSWFGGSIEVKPGDTVVVPLDAERMRALPLWTAVTTIIYNLAVAVAAVNSF